MVAPGIGSGHDWTHYYASDAPTKLDFSQAKNIPAKIESACLRFANNPAITAMALARSSVRPP